MSRASDGEVKTSADDGDNPPRPSGSGVAESKMDDAQHDGQGGDSPSRNSPRSPEALSPDPQPLLRLTAGEQRTDDDDGNENDKEAGGDVDDGADDGDNETTAMAAVIQSGDPDKLRMLLTGVSDVKAVELLKEKYGGKFYNPMYDFDKHGLVSGTSPLLQAARAGHVAMLKAVMDAMRSRQVKIDFKEADHCNRTLVQLAARSGNKETFDAVVGGLPEEEVTIQLKGKDEFDDTVLDLAAASGNEDTFGGVLDACRGGLSEEEINGLLTSRDALGRTVLMAAARSEGVGTFGAALAATRDALGNDKEQVMIQLKGKDRLDQTLLHLAAQSGKEDTFHGVLDACRGGGLSEQEIKDLLMSRDKEGRTVLMLAVSSRSGGTFRAALAATKDALGDDKQQLFRSFQASSEGFKNILEVAGATDVHMFEAVVASVRQTVNVDQMDVALVKARSEFFRPLLERAVYTNDIRLFGAVTRCARGVLGNQQPELDYFLSSIFRTVPHEEWIVVLLANYARPSPDDLINLSQRYGFGVRLRDICLEAVIIATNPFIAGTILSVALVDAAKKAPEGERDTLIIIQESVDALLLEILERLPQTVRGFKGGMAGCSAVFEPEVDGVKGESTSFKGPLSTLMERQTQMETFCSTPLIMDYLSRRFARGLPDLSDSEGVLSDKNQMEYLAGVDVGGQSMSLLLGGGKKEELDEEVERDRWVGAEWAHQVLLGKDSLKASFSSPGALLQGANPRFPRLTFLPGAQFMVAGILAKPSNYYRVPAMRMVLDLVVYLFVIAALSDFVLFHDDGPLTWKEGVSAATYIVAG